MKINGIYFNQEWAASVSKTEFVKTFESAYFQNLNDAERRQKLSKIYDELTKKKAPDPENTAPEQKKGTGKASE